MSDASMGAQYAALISWSKTPDRAARTAPARRALDESFLKTVREEFPDVDEATAVKMAEARKRAHFLAMARKSAAVRRARKAS